MLRLSLCIDVTTIIDLNASTPLSLLRQDLYRYPMEERKDAGLRYLPTLPIKHIVGPTVSSLRLNTSILLNGKLFSHLV